MRRRLNVLLTIDVAHPPRHPDTVEEELLRALTRVRSSPELRVLKIIHGYGSRGRGGSTRDTVRNFLFRHRNRFRRMIEGERLGLQDPDTMTMLRDLGGAPGVDLWAENPGVTIVWVK